MIYHLSIAAREPQRVASVIAELWQGFATPFPPVAEGSWLAMAGDDRASAIEVYPTGSGLHSVDGDADAVARNNPTASPRSASHAAIATPLSADAVHAIAAREGWIAKYRKRGNIFGVIELWLENDTMLEVLTADMQRGYLAGMATAKDHAPTGLPSA